MVLTDLLAWAGAQVDGPAVLYWRTSAGDEVDFVVEHQGHLLPSVKAAAQGGIPAPSPAGS